MGLKGEKKEEKKGWKKNGEYSVLLNYVLEIVQTWGVRNLTFLYFVYSNSEPPH